MEEQPKEQTQEAQPEASASTGEEQEVLSPSEAFEFGLLKLIEELGTDYKTANNVCLKVLANMRDKHLKEQASK